MSKRAEIIAAHPEFPWLTAGDVAKVEAELRRIGVISTSDRVTSADKAGQGNMNLTLRARITGDDGSTRSVIVKQSRPWVEKYDFIDAPWDRAIVEARFYERIAKLDGVRSRMPQLIASDAASRILVLEDLGTGTDLSSLYQSPQIELGTLDQLAAYLHALHDGTAGGYHASFDNREMRQLNAAHQFEIPLADPPALDLDALQPGLAAASAELRDDTRYREVVAYLNKRYRESRYHLLHGDFFPGSILASEHGPYVIDPEFCFFGDPEYDLGIFIAHLALARAPRAAAKRFLTAHGTFHRRLLSLYAANEVMRRLIGVAQLPLASDIDRVSLLLRSRDAMLGADWRVLFEEEGHR